jgi:hypothetical protein
MGMETTPPRIKSRRQYYRERPDTPAQPLQRSWRDVNKARMLVGLASAAAIPSAVYCFLLAVTLELSSEVLFWAGLLTAILALSWFIGLGSLFLAWLGRSSGIIGRFNCLALCATLSFFTPLLFTLVGTALSEPVDFNEGLDRIIAGTFCGLLFGPLGLFSGWILWRIAIRPTLAPIEEMVEVF